MKFSKTVSTSLLMGALVVALSACEPDEGPAEEAGKRIDEANEEIGEKIEAAGERIQDEAEGRGE